MKNTLPQKGINSITHWDINEQILANNRGITNRKKRKALIFGHPEKNKYFMVKTRIWQNLPMTRSVSLSDSRLVCYDMFDMYVQGV